MQNTNNQNFYIVEKFNQGKVVTGNERRGGYTDGIVQGYYTFNNLYHVTHSKELIDLLEYIDIDTEELNSEVIEEMQSTLDKDGGIYLEEWEDELQEYLYRYFNNGFQGIEIGRVQLVLPREEFEVKNGKVIFENEEYEFEDVDEKNIAIYPLVLNNSYVSENVDFDYGYEITRDEDNNVTDYEIFLAGEHLGMVNVWIEYHYNGKTTEAFVKDTWGHVAKLDDYSADELADWIQDTELGIEFY